MTKRGTSERLSVAEARRTFADVIRSAQDGTPVEITRNGEPVVAIVPIAFLRQAARPTLSEAVARFRASVRPQDLEGGDAFEGVRDRSEGREVDLA